jgi:hypothetical protein
MLKFLFIKFAAVSHKLNSLVGSLLSAQPQQLAAPSPLPSCAMYFGAGFNKSGPYTIRPSPSGPALRVWCDMANRGFTVIDPSVDPNWARYFKSWAPYGKMVPPPRLLLTPPPPASSVPHATPPSMRQGATPSAACTPPPPAAPF